MGRGLMGLYIMIRGLGGDEMGGDGCYVLLLTLTSCTSTRLSWGIEKIPSVPLVELSVRYTRTRTAPIGPFKG
jgi:hypothetical protein